MDLLQDMINMQRLLTESMSQFLQNLAYTEYGKCGRGALVANIRSVDLVTGNLKKIPYVYLPRMAITEMNFDRGLQEIDRYVPEEEAVVIVYVALSKSQSNTGKMWAYRICKDAQDLLPDDLQGPARSLANTAQRSFQPIENLVQFLSKDACAACGQTNEKFKVCKNCRLARYCNAECQKADWGNGHKERCNEIGAIKKETKK